MNARESDPFHDDNITQEEFESAAAMNFPLITIPDPAAVGEWLDTEQPQTHGWTHLVYYSLGKLSTEHWLAPSEYVDAEGETPDELLANLRAKLAEHDPIDKLRKEAESAGYVLTRMPTD